MIQEGLFSGAHEIGKTSGYRFEDPFVGRVAQFKSYYDPRIRELDLALRDAKAQAALARRRGVPCRSEIARGIELIHSTYCSHLLGLIDAVAEDAPEQTIASLIATFVQRTARLAAVMRDILRRTQGGTPAAVDPLAFSAAQ
jgi:hypothetical protein